MPRFKIISLLVASSLLALAACGGVDPSAGDELRDAVPTRAQLSFDVPGAAAAAGERVGERTFALVGEQADMYRTTYDTTRGLNGAVWIGLQTIESIVQHPPTATKDGVATWGPHTGALEPLTWLLVVKKEQLPTHYSYALAARQKGDTNGKFVPILAGTSRRGVGGWVGIYAANATALNQLDPQGHPATGKLIAKYDTRLGKRAVVLALSEYSEAGEEPVDLAYRYLALHSGAGLFRFVAKADLHQDGSAEEVYVMATQWNEDGAGRGDALISGGDVPAGIVVHVTECWDEGFARTFYTDNVKTSPTEGDASQCVFSNAPADDEPSVNDAPALPENGQP